MGGGSSALSLKIENITSQDLGELMMSLPAAYHGYKKCFLDNGIDGKTLKSIKKEKMDIFLEDLGISNTAHQLKLIAEFDILRSSSVSISNIYSNYQSSVIDSSCVENFSTATEYFVFGEEDDFIDGLRNKIKSLPRSMEEECLINDTGKYKDDYMYVAYNPAYKRSDAPHRIRDLGHTGMTLDDFFNNKFARAANLTRAEVAALRLYTGP